MSAEQATAASEEAQSTAMSAAEAKEETQEKDSSWMGLIINVVITLVLVAGMIGVYHYTVASQTKQKIAVVDIAEILGLKELQVTAAATNPDATDRQRAEAFEEITRFARDMETAVNDLQSECGCTLLVRAAVVKANAAEDLTPALKERLGMAGLDQAKLVQQLRSSGGIGQAPMLGGKELGAGSKK